MNNLNQLMVISHGGRLPVSGSTTSPATNVTVNGTSASLYGDNTFNWNMSANTGLNTFTAIAQDIYNRRSTNVSTVNVIPTNRAYAYDLNGNLLTDGTRNFAYDDENQLISVWQTNAWKSEYTYDGKMRRRILKEYTWNGSWQQTNEVRFIYDGNLVVQERNANNQPQVTYTRGNDLSGTLQGAGGIAGLLARTDNSQTLDARPQPQAHAFYHSDGNGNITCLLYANGQLAAKYLYDPFGNTLAQFGALAEANAYRFSSKEWNANAGLYYYLYRFYDPNLQRWVNRDPIEEAGGINLYRFVGNNSINNVDLDGNIVIALPLIPILISAGDVAAVGGGVAIGGAVGIGIGEDIYGPKGDIVYPPVVYPPTYPGQVNDPPISVSVPICMANNGNGERGIQANDPNPWKGWRPDPNRPGWGTKKDKQTGKTKPTRRPNLPPPKNHPDW